MTQRHTGLQPRRLSTTSATADMPLKQPVEPGVDIRTEVHADADCVNKEAGDYFVDHVRQGRVAHLET